MKRVISVAAFSCSDDDHLTKAENNKVAHTEIITKKISWEEIQHEIVKSAIEELRGQLSQDISFARGGQSDLLSGLSIVQDNIIYKEYYGRYSYTFATHREESNGFLENIIIEVGQNGEYSESLIQYEMSQEEIAWLAAGEIIDLDDRLIIYTPLEGVNFSDILGRSAGCYTVEWSAPVGWCSNLGMSEQDAFNLGYSQSECGLVVVYTVTITDHCSESEGGDGGNGGLPGNGGNPYNPYDPWGGQGGGPNNGGPQGPITDPNPGGGGGSYTQVVINQLNNYFGIGNWSFASNSNINPTSAPHFNSVSEAYDFVYDTPDFGNEGVLVSNTQNTSDRITHFNLKFWTTLTGGARGVNLYLKQSIDTDLRPNVTNVNTTWYGGSGYHTWNQVDYSLENTNICSACKKITIYGELKTGFFINDIGIFSHNTYRIEIILQKNGEIWGMPSWLRID